MLFTWCDIFFGVFLNLNSPFPGPSGPPALAPAPRGWSLVYHAALSDPMDESHTFDLTLKAPKASSLRTIKKGFARLKTWVLDIFYKPLLIFLTCTRTRSHSCVWSSLRIGKVNRKQVRFPKYGCYHIKVYTSMLIPSYLDSQSAGLPPLMVLNIPMYEKLYLTVTLLLLSRWIFRIESRWHIWKSGILPIGTVRGFKFNH